MQPRTFLKMNKKFCCSFVGKTYPLRLHAIEELSRINAIDVFGTSVRNTKKFPGKIAANYRFCLFFGNEVYPGYVTEKSFVSYFAGTIPLYYGLDKEKFLNLKAVINLIDCKTLRLFGDHINAVNSNYDLYKYHYEQPLLIKKPNLESIISKISELLR